jgi:hypothetical protein
MRAGFITERADECTSGVREIASNGVGRNIERCSYAFVEKGEYVPSQAQVIMGTDHLLFVHTVPTVHARWRAQAPWSVLDIKISNANSSR